jgi:hypothetical protein
MVRLGVCFRIAPKIGPEMGLSKMQHRRKWPGLEHFLKTPLEECVISRLKF